MMTSKQHKFIAATLLIVILFSALFNVPAALADGETPTEPPVATEVGTEPQAESTPEPVQPTAAPEEPLASPEAVESETPQVMSTPEPAAEQSSAIAGVLSGAPEDTNLVVLDEQGQSLALGTQETADAVVNSDPVWCPAGVSPPTPGLNGCSISYGSITDLLTAMRDTPASFDADGTIFLEVLSSPGFTTPLILDDSAGSLSSAFASLSLNDLTVRGGWNPATNSVSGAQALFGKDGSNEGYILIGSLANPWVGNVRLEDIEVRAASVANAITIYTSSGNILFDDVDVADQTGDKYLAYLHSISGDITVGNGSNFDGNDTGVGINESKGFFAQTGGSITINNTSGSYTFRDNEGTDPDAHNGATLIAPTVTLNNVISRANDGNGIQIEGASLITLTDVVSSLNQSGGSGNGLSGILILDTAATIVNVHGGTFAKNGRYGIELFNGTGTLVLHSAPTCPTTGVTANGLGCYNVTPVAPTVEPTPTEPTPTEPTPTEPTPTEPTPTEPTPTEPTPTQPTATEPSPTQPTPTEGTPVPPTVAPTESTSPAPTGSGIGTAGASGSSSLGSGSSTDSIVPLTGGELIDLDCDSVFTAFGIRLSFFELCDHQTVVNQVDGAELPGDLPEGMSFVTGLDLSVLNDGQALESLPAGAGVQLDFPVGAGEYAVLFWDEVAGAWVEISSPLGSSEIAGALGNDEGDGLYQLSPSAANFLQALTTEKTGIFVLVQKS